MLILAQLQLRLLSRRDIGKENRDMRVLRCVDTKRKHIEPAASKLGRLQYEARALAGEGHLPIDIEPVLLVSRSQLTHALALDGSQAGMTFQRGVGFEEAVIHGALPLVEHHLDDAEPFVDGIEQGAVTGLAEARGRGRTRPCRAHALVEHEARPNADMAIASGTLAADPSYNARWVDAAPSACQRFTRWICAAARSSSRAADRSPATFGRTRGSIRSIHASNDRHCA